MPIDFSIRSYVDGVYLYTILYYYIQWVHTYKVRPSIVNFLITPHIGDEIFVAKMNRPADIIISRRRTFSV